MSGEPAGEWTCPSCGTRLPETAKFCTKCGRARSCGWCGAELPQTTMFCPSCGRVVGNAAAGPNAGLPADTTPPPSYAAMLGAVSAFGAPMAGWWQRVGAYLLDGLILSVPVIILDVISFVVLFPHVFSSSQPWLTCTYGPHGALKRCYFHDASLNALLAREAVFSIVGCVIPGLYFSLLNGLGRGQTVGNMAAGIAVRDARTGSAIGWGRGIVRLLVRILLYGFLVIPGLLNDLWPLWDDRRQTLADKACNSVMIRVR